jgi:hypothetical protein
MVIEYQRIAAERRMPRHEIADHLGLTSETVSRSRRTGRSAQVMADDGELFARTALDIGQGNGPGGSRGPWKP